MKKLNQKEERRRLRNRSVLSSMGSRLRMAGELIVKREQAEGAVLEAVKALDRAARKRVIHSNNAARHKSRLMKKLHQAKASAGS